MAPSPDDTTMSSGMTTPTQPDTQLSQISDHSSLTSVPSDIGSTPEEFKYQASSRGVSTGSPAPVCRRSERQRKISTRAIESENSSANSPQKAVKRMKISPPGTDSTEKTTQSFTTHLQSVIQSSSSRSKTKSKVSPKLILKCPPPATIKLNVEEDQQWPESDVRSEPLPSSAPTLPIPILSEEQTQESIETDIALSFLAKIRNQHYEPVKAAAVVLSHIDSPSSTKATLKYRRAKKQSKTTRSAAASGAEKGSNNGSSFPSPSERTAKSGGITKNTKGQGRFGKGKNRNGGNGGRDRDSPEPHEKLPRTHDEQLTLKSLRQRQLDLKKFFAVLSGQQTEALDIMSSRDLSKLHKRSTAHTKVPEFDETYHFLEAKLDQVRSLIDQDFKMRQELATRILQAEQEVIENSFLNRARESKAEHLKGAEGDLMILQNAHKSQIDETRTDNGSDGATNLPLYHELPEPNARIRGYSSVRIDDEKPFKEHLASYDEQAQREVIDDDIVAPVMHSVAKENAERLAEEEEKAREKLDGLASIAESELKQIYDQPAPGLLDPETNPQFALSRLADCADLRSQQEPGKEYRPLPENILNLRMLPGLPLEALMTPRTLPELPRESSQKMIRPTPGPSTYQHSHPPSLHNPVSSSRPKSPPVRKKKSVSAPSKRMIKEEEMQSQSSSNTSTPLPNIAPAPSRMPPPPVSNQHHHHHMPQQTMPPPPSSMTAVPAFARHTNLAPLITPRTRSTPPGTPIHLQGYPLSSHIPPPPSPFQSRPSPILGPYQHQQPSPRAMQYPPLTHPPPSSPFLAQSPQVQGFEPAPRRSVEPQQAQAQTQTQTQPQSLPLPTLAPPQPTAIQPQPPRFALTNTISPHLSRPLGQRRGSGQITFTPTQTPSSERFTRPPGPAPQLPGRSVIRPSQLTNGAPSAPNRMGSTVLSNTPEARAQSAADIARQNALNNQVQGAGPKGGKRVLLPKS